MPIALAPCNSPELRALAHEMTQTKSLFSKFVCLSEVINITAPPHPAKNMHQKKESE